MVVGQAVLRGYLEKFVIPGLTRNPDVGFDWIPAFAGMTINEFFKVP